MVFHLVQAAEFQSVGLEFQSVGLEYQSAVQGLRSAVGKTSGLLSGWLLQYVKVRQSVWTIS